MLFNKEDIKKIPWVVWFWLIVVFYSSLTIYGYHQDDEFGRTVGFYLYKLGLMPAEGMAVDFHLKMRPWLQPAIYTLLLGPIIKLIGYQHFLVERITHIFHFLLVLLVTPFMVQMAKPRDLLLLKNKRYKAILLFSLALWFVPSMWVRHSAEAIGAIFIIISLGFWYKAENKKKPLYYILAGLFSGLAFYSRFAVAVFFVFFIVVQLVFALRYEKTIKPIVFYLLGLVVALSMGVLIDFWGYGEFTFSFYNYLYQNIFHGMAAGYGTKPWYYLWYQGMAFTAMPFLYVILAVIAWLARKDKFLLGLVIAILGFQLVHSFIGHKESRFLFPIAPVLMIVLIKGGEFIVKSTLPWVKFFKSRKLWLPFAIINLIALLSFTLFGLVRDKFQITVSLNRLSKGSEVISNSNIYGREAFAEIISEPLQNHILLPITRAKDIRLVAAQPLDMPKLCKERSGDYILLTNYDKIIKNGQEIIPVDFSYRTIAQNPPAFTEAFKGGWYQRMWRYKLMSCEQFLKGFGKSYKD